MHEDWVENLQPRRYTYDRIAGGTLSEMPLILYSVRETIGRIKELTGRAYTDQGLRKLMDSGKLRKTMIGNLTVVTEDDIQHFLRTRESVGGEL